MAWLNYGPTVERPASDEAETFAKIIEAFEAESELTRKQTGRVMRVSHAVASGLMTGVLEVDGGLPPDLAQGLFARPGRFDVLVRLAQGPGEHVPDHVSTHRGMAVKVLGAPGDKLPESDEPDTQDFVFEAGTTFPLPDAAAFLLTLQGLSKAPLVPNVVKHAIAGGGRTANAALNAVGKPSRNLDFFGHPKRHPLNEAYFSQAPMRWGEHVAKVGLFPLSYEQAQLGPVDTAGDRKAFRTALVAHAAEHRTVFEVRVQLAVAGDTMPIEDASVEWPEAESRYRPVGRIVLPPQNAYSEARRAFFDERLSFSPAHSLMEHRPLGSVMRARLAVYPEMARRRFARTGAARSNPKGLDEVPG